MIVNFWEMWTGWIAKDFLLLNHVTYYLFKN